MLYIAVGYEPTAHVPEVALMVLTVGTRTVASVQSSLSER